MLTAISIARCRLILGYCWLILVWFGLVSLFNGISTLFRLFNAKAILLEEQLWYYLTHSWEDKGVHTLPKRICPKVNVIARQEYELAYYDSAVHRFNHYTTRTPHLVDIGLLPVDIGLLLLWAYLIYIHYEQPTFFSTLHCVSALLTEAVNYADCISTER